MQAALSQLVEMGFELAVAERAITLGGDAEAALQLLLDGAIGAEDPSAAPAPLPTDRQALLERKTVLQREIAEAMGKDAPSAHDSAAHSRRLDEYRELTRRIDGLPSEPPSLSVPGPVPVPPPVAIGSGVHARERISHAVKS